jgi:multiple sugar transport system substrate-binding protein
MKVQVKKWYIVEGQDKEPRESMLLKRIEIVKNFKTGSLRLTVSLLLLICLAMGACQKDGVSTQKTIRFTSWGSPASNKIYQAVVDEFEAKHPQIKVDFMMLPWSQYHRKILTMLAAGSKLDVMRLANSYFPQFVEKDVLLSLNKYVQLDGKEIDLDDFYPMALRGCKAEGHLYGLPLDIVGWALYYNRGMFDKAGLAYPNESWTWETFLDVARKLTRDLDGDGIIDQYGAYVKLKMGVIELLAGQSGAMILDRNNSKCLFDSPEGQAVIQLLYDLIVKHKVVPRADFRAGQDVFAAQKAAMAILMRGNVTGYRQSLALDWDVGPVPKWPGKEPRALIIGGFNPWVICKNTELSDESWEFLKFLIGKEAATEMVKTGRFVPARRSVAESSAFLDTSPPEHNIYFLDLVRTSNKVFVPRFPRYKRLEKVFEDNFQLLCDEKTTVKECASGIRRDVDRLIQEIEMEQKENASDLSHSPTEKNRG